MIGNSGQVNLNQFEIVGQGELTLPSLTTVSDGTNTYSGFCSAFDSHPLGYTPAVIAYFAVSGSQYSLMPYSETVSANSPSGGFLSQFFRLTVSDTSVTAYHYAISVSAGISGSTFPGGEVIKYYLLKETAS